MAVIYRFSQVTKGGNGQDNPVPLTIENYHLNDAERKLFTYSINVIVPDHTGEKQVTALATIDPETKDPLTGPGDPCAMPCPPCCQ